MRLYLSSYRMGTAPEALASLLGTNRRAGLIPNATDPWNDIERSRARLARETADLAAIGCTTEILDLRAYFGRADTLAQAIAPLGLVWAHGGNSFVLKRAFEQSGFDRLLGERLQEGTIVYGGYSAAIMMVMPTLRGIELCDDPVVVPVRYSPAFRWDALGLIAYSVVPHFRSHHPESAMMEDVVACMESNSLPYRTLRDGEAIVVDGDRESIAGAPHDYFPNGFA